MGGRTSRQNKNDDNDKTICTRQKSKECYYRFLVLCDVFDLCAIIMDPSNNSPIRLSHLPTDDQNRVGYIIYYKLNGLCMSVLSSTHGENSISDDFGFPRTFAKRVIHKARALKSLPMKMCKFIIDESWTMNRKYIEKRLAYLCSRQGREECDGLKPKFGSETFFRHLLFDGLIQDILYLDAAGKGSYVNNIEVLKKTIPFMLGYYFFSIEQLIHLCAQCNFIDDVKIILLDLFYKLLDKISFRVTYNKLTASNCDTHYPECLACTLPSALLQLVTSYDSLTERSVYTREEKQVMSRLHLLNKL